MDEDGDLCTIGTTEEFQLALSSARDSGTTLKVLVNLDDAPPQSQPMEVEAPPEYQEPMSIQDEGEEKKEDITPVPSYAEAVSAQTAAVMGASLLLYTLVRVLVLVLVLCFVALCDVLPEVGSRYLHLVLSVYLDAKGASPAVHSSNDGYYYYYYYYYYLLLLLILLLVHLLLYYYYYYCNHTHMSPYVTLVE
jgi:hypothetical protein